MTDVPSPTTAGAAEATGVLDALSRPADAPLVAALLDLLARLDLAFSVKDAASGQYLMASPRMAALFGTILAAAALLVPFGQAFLGPLRRPDLADAADLLPRIEGRRADGLQATLNVGLIAGGTNTNVVPTISNISPPYLKVP